MLPDYVKNSRPTYLIPVGSESNKEVQVLSSLLSTFPVVDGWLQSAFSSALSIRVGKQTKIECFTEVEFSDPAYKSIRPDGLIVVSTGRTKWHGLVEAKIKAGKQSKEQLEAYAHAAKKHGIDALISISNEMVSRPDHHHVDLPKTLTRSLEYLHFSWASILSNAQVLSGQKGIEDPEQEFILKELIKYLSHESSGINRFDQMSPAWTEIVKQAVQLFPLQKSSEQVSSVAADWIQESRDLSLKISEFINERVQVRYSRKAAADPSILRKEIVDEICESKTLTAALDIPNAAGPMELKANLSNRQVSVGMGLVAPKDKKSTSARVNWLLRMLKDSQTDELLVTASWPSRVPDTFATVGQLRLDPSVIQCDNPKHAPVSFNLVHAVDDIRAFNGRRTFVSLVEQSAAHFYEIAGQHLKAWQPSPPKTKPHNTPSDETEASSTNSTYEASRRDDD